jgi:hypothetical protein
MRTDPSITGLAMLLAFAAGLAPAGDAQASALKGQPLAGISARADFEVARFLRVTTRSRHPFPAAKPAPENSRAAAPAAGTRAARPVVTASAAGAGQAGYVHYFIVQLPDESLEIQVGIELPDQRIAWSFPELGAVISPFIESGVVQAGGRDYEVWHLYGIRPFPDDAAMARLGRELAGRVQPWIRAGTPYCENDGPDSHCMSCLGFVLRALFPGRGSDYPGLPRDFWRAGTASRYTTRDLLLYLTGMLDLPTREARLQRLARLQLPEALREDVEALVYSMGASESSGSAAPGASPKRPVARPATTGARPDTRRKQL